MLLRTGAKRRWTPCLHPPPPQPNERKESKKSRHLFAPRFELKYDPEGELDWRYFRAAGVTETTPAHIGRRPHLVARQRVLPTRITGGEILEGRSADRHGYAQKQKNLYVE